MYFVWKVCFFSDKRKKFFQKSIRIFFSKHEKSILQLSMKNLSLSRKSFFFRSKSGFFEGKYKKCFVWVRKLFWWEFVFLGVLGRSTLDYLGQVWESIGLFYFFTINVWHEIKSYYVFIIFECMLIFWS